MGSVQLSEYEGAALRDCAEKALRARACDRLLALTIGQTKPGGFEFQHDLLVAASEVYAVLDAALPACCLRSSGSEKTIDVAFTEKGMEWLYELRGEVRRGLEDSRGSTEINANAPAETFLLFVLDGICAKAEF